MTILATELIPPTPLLDIKGILEYLPHRYPFLLVDKVIEAVPNERILAQKNVTINEPFFVGHFPNYAVMPGVLILESLAQTAAILSFLSQGTKPDKNSVYYFVGIDGARFKRPVVPGDVLMLEVSILRVSRGIWKYFAQAKVDGQVASQAELMCTVRSIEK
jgi:3-hydroxyacyl-[acyl-carrier-protein] dehydratase